MCRTLQFHLHICLSLYEWSLGWNPENKTAKTHSLWSVHIERLTSRLSLWLSLRLKMKWFETHFCGHVFPTKLLAKLVASLSLNVNGHLQLFLVKKYLSLSLEYCNVKYDPFQGKHRINFTLLTFTYNKTSGYLLHVLWLQSRSPLMPLFRLHFQFPMSHLQKKTM